MATMKTRTMLIILCALAGLIAVLFLLFWPCLVVRFGNHAMRQAVISDWGNQGSKLSGLQRQVLTTLLYKDVSDPHAPTMALAVLNAHIREDEDETVRHLLYVAFTTSDLTECRIALSGLLKVSTKHGEAAKAVFWYRLHTINPDNVDRALLLSICVGGLADYSCREALPRIRQFTNNPSKYLSVKATEAVRRLEEPTARERIVKP